MDRIVFGKKGLRRISIGALVLANIFYVVEVVVGTNTHWWAKAVLILFLLMLDSTMPLYALSLRNRFPDGVVEEQDSAPDEVAKEVEDIDHESAYYVGTHRYSWRAGQPLLITGVAMFSPVRGGSPRACFVVKSDDGEGDFAAIEDTDFYELISRSDVEAGRIPAVIH